MSSKLHHLTRTSCAALALTLLAGSPALAADARLRMATTTSTENSGLLKVLLPPFEQKHGCKVDVISVGTGKALKLGETGDVDVVLVHARALEDKFVADGFGVNRRDVMYNDFVVLGPKADPAGVRAAKQAREAFKRIAAAQATFVSRADKSGTHEKELEVWKDAGTKPEGKWYLEAGQGMGEVIVMAGERLAYTLADRGTWLSMRAKTPTLDIVSQGDPILFNPYGVIAVNPARNPSVNTALAGKFIDFLTGPEAKALINGFKVDGEQLFKVASP